MTINWKKRSYTKKAFIDAWLSSRTMAEVSRKLGSNFSGSGYHTIREAAESLGLSKEDLGSIVFVQKTEEENVKKNKVFSLEDILSNKIPYSNTSRLKKKLIKAGILEAECSECHITSWRGKPAPLASRPYKWGTRRQ